MQSISGDSLSLFYWAKVCGINTLSYLCSSVSVQGNKKVDVVRYTKWYKIF